jgi:hypothetical protein
MESNDSNTSTKIEQFLKPKAVSSRKLARDAEGRLLMAEESALDMDRIRDAGVTVRELGRRVRLFNTDMTKQLAAYIVPIEVSEMTAASAELSVGAKIQVGRLTTADGLYLRHNPGVREIGINDRGDVIMRLDAATAEDSTIGPVLNAYNTTQSTLTNRLVPRIDKKTHDRDVKEARAWLEAMNVLSGGKTLRTRFFSAGVACEHRGNIPQLYKTVQVNFFQVNDPLSLELSSALEERFREVDRPVPMVRVISVVGIPPNERAYKEFVGQLKNKKQNPMALGLPSRLRDSQFFDGASKSIVPSCFIYACTLDEIGDSIYIITINTDYHGEVKCRGVHSGVASAMSIGDVISAHASSAMLSSKGTATLFMGVSNAGKSRAATFWSERNETARRDELLRRYEILHQAKKVEEKPEELLKAVGILIQDDWVQIVPSDEHVWDVWPAERQFYMRSRDMLSRSLILSENEPIIENATGDFGAAGKRDCLGQTTHCYPDERLFYDGDWDNYHCDREVHRLSAVVLLEKDPDLDYAVKHLSKKDALEHILRGGASDSEDAQPFLNDYTDVSSLLIGQGVVGDRLLESYKSARKGDVAALMNGDEALGRVVLDKLHTQVELWQLLFEDIPIFVVNTIHGDDLTQDIHWYVSEFPEALKTGRELSVSDFRDTIEQKFKVLYDDDGNWSELG